MITALTAATGSTRWSVTTGGPIDASPLIVAGNVYIGSIDHRLYAVAESTGTVAWTFATGGEIQSSASTSQGEIHFGSDDGFVYGLNAVTGSVSLALDIKAPVRGVSEATHSLYIGTSTGWLYEWRNHAVGWKYNYGASLTGSPSIVDSAIYVGATDGTLSCFSLFGSRPDL
jgi:outer membrane protein assembly factor BamB